MRWYFGLSAIIGALTCDLVIWLHPKTWHFSTDDHFGTPLLLGLMWYTFAIWIAVGVLVFRLVKQRSGIVLAYIPLLFLLPFVGLLAFALRGSYYWPGSNANRVDGAG
jgi:hypothetical protein